MATSDSAVMVDAVVSTVAQGQNEAQTMERVEEVATLKVMLTLALVEVAEVIHESQPSAYRSSPIAVPTDGIKSR